MKTNFGQKKIRGKYKCTEQDSHIHTFILIPPLILQYKISVMGHLRAFITVIGYITAAARSETPSTAVSFV